MGNSQSINHEKSEKVDKEHAHKPKFTEKQILNAKKINFCFNVLLFRKKAQDFKDTITREIEKQCLFPKELTEVSFEGVILKKFDEIFLECKKILKKLKFDTEADSIKLKHKDLSIPQEELKEYYISQLEKHNLDSFTKLIHIIDEVEYSLKTDKDEEKPKPVNKKEAFPFFDIHALVEKGKKRIFNFANKNVVIEEIQHTDPISNIDRQKIGKEFDNLFNYIEPKKHYVLIDYFLGNGSFPKDIKNFINKFFFLSLMIKSDSIENTIGYIQIQKKEIKKLLLKNYIDNSEEDDEIIDENYNDLFEMIDHMKKEDSVEHSNPKDHMKKEDSVEHSNPKVDSIGDVHNIISAELNNTRRNAICINEKNKNNHHKHCDGATFKRNSEHLDYQFYNGDYDTTNFLYCGTGSLVKNRKSRYYYHGTFRMGKKHGVGIIYKFKSDFEYEYYRGEWSNNTQDGFGFQIIADERHNKKKIVRKGKFIHNCLCFGSQLIIIEKDSDIKIEKYEGEMTDNLYSGQGTLSKKALKFNKLDKTKMDVEWKYEYDGQFLNNLENGKGVSKKSYEQLNYSYIYEGEFLNGKMHGEGKIKYTGDYYIDTYEGIFQNDQQFCVYGKVKFLSGDEYEGFFNEDQQKTKVGLYFHFDKNQKNENFFGKFLNDKKDGLGRFISSKECKVLVGTYNDGEKNGNFSLTSNNYEEFEHGGNKLNYSNKFSNYNYMTMNFKNNITTSSSSISNTNNNSNQTKTECIKQSKLYFLFENDEIIERSDRPIS